jgi:hypothetical protein
VADRAFAEDPLAFRQRRLTFKRILGRDRKVAEDPRTHKANPSLAADRQGPVQQVHGLCAARLCASDHGKIVEADRLESFGTELSSEDQRPLGMHLHTRKLAGRAKHVARRVMGDDFRTVMPDPRRQFDADAWLLGLRQGAAAQPRADARAPIV